MTRCHRYRLLSRTEVFSASLCARIEGRAAAHRVFILRLRFGDTLHRGRVERRRPEAPPPIRGGQPIRIDQRGGPDPRPGSCYHRVRPPPPICRRESTRRPVHVDERRAIETSDLLGPAMAIRRHHALSARPADHAGLVSRRHGQCPAHSFVHFLSDAVSGSMDHHRRWETIQAPSHDQARADAPHRLSSAPPGVPSIEPFRGALERASAFGLVLLLALAFFAGSKPLPNSDSRKLTGFDVRPPVPPPRLAPVPAR